jgi:hypothetical protein
MATSWYIMLLLNALKREKLRKPEFCDCLFPEYLAHKACLGFVGSISAVYLGFRVYFKEEVTNVEQGVTGILKNIYVVVIMILW